MALKPNVAESVDSGNLTTREFEDAVELIASEQNAELIAREDAEAVLRELDMPAARLGAAVATVRERHALEAEAAIKRKARYKYALIGIAAVIVVTGVGLWTQRGTQAKRSAVTAIRPMLVDEPGQLKLHATLMGIPQGEVVDVRCTWRAVDGTILHENAYRTKPVSHDAWDTHCTLKNAPDHVKVEMRAFERVLAQAER
jgi:hypothetical protein